MSKQNNKASSSRHPSQSKEPSLAQKLLKALGPSPVLPTENTRDYEAIIQSVISSSEAKSAVEILLVRDFVAATWELQRFKRCKTQKLRQHQCDAVRDALSEKKFIPESPRLSKEELEDLKSKRIAELCDGWAKGKPDAVAEIREIFDRSELTLEEIETNAVLDCQFEFEKIDRVISQIEQRQLRVLRDLDRHRESLARQVRAKMQAIEDAFAKSSAAEPSHATSQKQGGSLPRVRILGH